MNFFFELKASRIGYSRIGRISLSKDRKLYINTPNLMIPIKNSLMKQFSFIQEFESHKLFIISKEIFLRIGFLREKFKDTGFIFSYNGTFEKFEDILIRNLDIFTEDNIISILPFNVPTTSINKDFAEVEITAYLKKAKKILKQYPNLNFGITIRIFDYTELFDLYIPIIKKNENIKILNLSDIFDNFNNFRGIAKIISEVKAELDNNLVVMASGRIIPKLYPILVYLGIDLIDSSFLLYLSAENFYDTIEYLLPIYKVRYFPCACVACKGKLKNLFDIKHSSEKIDLLCLHNLISATNYINKISQYLNYEDYRTFVEKSTFDDTNLISILKILDKDYFHLMRYETPITIKNRTIRCLGPTSYNRPDFREYRERTLTNFGPEPWTTLIILLPCSAKKPYSESKSHKLFYKKIRKFSEFPNFQEFILTSPLGVIPRQLENIYPVNSYDISVTGDWNNEEINITANMLIKILEKYNNDIPIICHLKDEYYEIVKRVKSKLAHKFFFTTVSDKLTSKESLQSLEDLINEYKDIFKSKQQLKKGNCLTKSWIRKFNKILDYQFGIGSGMRVISQELTQIKLKSNGNVNLIDKKSKVLLGIFRSSTGQIDLTLKGINRLVKTPYSIDSNTIVFDANFIRGNTLFRKGIIAFSRNLIPNNFTYVLNKDKNDIIGTGNLLVGSNFIKNSKTGRVVKINDKK
ncbi:MAG: DUF5591 domain-containing protein [Promethearchaeota archaeon]